MSGISTKSAQELIDETAKIRLSFFQQVKQGLFDVYGKIVNNRKCSTILMVVVHLIMYLQIVDYVLELRSYASKNDEVYSFVFQITGYFRISAIFPRSGLDGALSILGAILSSLSLFYGLLLGYSLYSLRGKGAKKKSHSLNDCFVLLMVYLSFIFSYVLISPSIDTLISLFKCGGATHQLEPTLKCWGTTHVILVSVYTPFLLIHLLEVIIIALLFNEYTPDGSDSMARMDCSYMELRIFLYKIFLSFISQLWKHEDWNIPIVPLIFVALPLLYFLYSYLTRLHYYSRATSLVYSSGLGINLWFACYLIGQEIMGRNSGGLIMLLGALLVPLALSFYRSKAIKSLIYCERYDRIQNDQLIGIYCQSYLDFYLNQERDSSKKLALIGYTSLHSHECYAIDCPLKDKNLAKSQSGTAGQLKEKDIDAEPDTVIHLLLIKEMLGIYTKKANASANVHLLFSSFLTNLMGNTFKAATELVLALRVNPTFQEEYSVFRAQKRLLREIKKHHLSKVKKNKTITEAFDVRLSIQYEKLCKKLEKKIEAIANDYSELWGILEGVMPDLNMLHTKGVEVMRQNMKIEEVWKEITAINEDNRRMNSIFGKYARELKNDKEEGDALLEGAKNFAGKVIVKENSFSKGGLMFADDTGVIIANSSGTIVKHNVGLTKLFAYSTQELVGQYVQMLMPQIIGRVHNKLVDMCIETGNKGELHKRINSVALHRFGDLLSILMIIKPIPCLTEGIQFISFMRKNDKDSYMIMTDVNGKIETFSSNFGELVGISPQNLKNHEVYIQLFFPSLAEFTSEPDLKGERKTFLEEFKEDDSDEGTPIEMELLLAKQIRDVILKMQVKEQKNDDDQETDQESTYKVLAAYSAQTREITNFTDNEESNLMTSVIQYSDCEVERKMKGSTWYRNYGNGLARLRLFKLKLSRSTKLKDKNRPNAKEVEKLNNRIIKKAAIKRESWKKRNSSENIIDMIGNVKKWSSNMELRSKEKAPGSMSNIKIEESKVADTKIPLNFSSENFGERDEDADASQTVSADEDQKDKGEEGALMQAMVKEFNQRDNKKDMDKMAADDTSSTVNSSTISFARQIQTMRNFNRQKVTPRSIQNLKIAAIIVFLTLLILTIVFFIYSTIVFDSLWININLLEKAQTLLNNIVTITSMTRLLTLVQTQNGQFVNSYDNYHGDVKNFLQNSISKLSGQLQDAQKTFNGINIESGKEKINITYNNAAGFLQKYQLDVESTVLSFVVHSMNVASKSPADCNPDDASFSFILANGLNNIIENEWDSCWRIVNESMNDEKSEETTLLIIMCVASAALLSSLLVLVPVTVSVNKNREEIVMMFTEIPLQKIKEEAEKCRQYCSQLRCGEEKPVMLGNNGEPTSNMLINPEYPEAKAMETPQQIAQEGVNGIDEDEKKFLSSEAERLNNSQPKSAHKKRYVHFNNPIIGVVLRLLLLMLVLESYFIFGYFQSTTNLNALMDTSFELASTYMRQFSNSFVLGATQELIGTNLTSTIRNKNSSYLTLYVDQLIDEQDSYQKLHLANEAKHTSSYNTLFSNIVFGNMCEFLFTDQKDISTCVSDIYGLPSKGMKQINVAFWESSRQVLSDFLKIRNIKQSLNDNRMLQNEIIIEKYLSKAYITLSKALNGEIRLDLDNGSKIMLIVFIVYIIVLVVIFIMWQFFISATSDNLHNTRTMMGIIPPDVIKTRKKIRDYMVNTSKLLFSAANN